MDDLVHGKGRGRAWRIRVLVIHLFGHELEGNIRVLHQRSEETFDHLAVPGWHTEEECGCRHQTGEEAGALAKKWVLQYAATLTPTPSFTGRSTMAVVMAVGVGTRV